MKSIKLSIGTRLIAYLLLISAANAQQPVAPLTADNEYQASAVLFAQKAAEHRALAYQAFNVARWRLDADLDKNNVKKLPKSERKRPRAIIVDVDETVLDNSPEMAYKIKHHLLSVKGDFFAWTEKRQCKAVPGAVDFINYAHSKGVKVFYVSNRDDAPQLAATIDNLKSVGFPDISAENVLLRTKISSKEPRRQSIGERYRIVLLIGDNLDDFSTAFEQRSIVERFAETDKVKDLWGDRFIVLPNSQYGTWEKAIYEYQILTDAEKAKKRAEALELP